MKKIRFETSLGWVVGTITENTRTFSQYAGFGYSKDRVEVGKIVDVSEGSEYLRKLFDAKKVLATDNGWVRVVLDYSFDGMPEYKYEVIEE